MDILSSKEPSYIRCIKPNEFKASGESIGSRAIVLNNIDSMFALHLIVIGILYSHELHPSLLFIGTFVDKNEAFKFTFRI